MVLAPLSRPLVLCGLVAVVNGKKGMERDYGAFIRPVHFAKSGFGYAEEIPFRFPFRLGQHRAFDRSTNFMAAATLERFLQAEQRLAAASQSLLDNPGASGLPNVEYFGRSIEGQYQLQLTGTPPT